MSKVSLTPQQLLSFYRQAEQLKTTLRHSWLNDGKRQESVAEHTWMMALLAMILVPQMKAKLSLQKILQLIIIHDLAEAITTDMPVWQGIENKTAKVAVEEQAMHQLLSQLDENSHEQLFELWQEYEQRQSAEAVFVKVLDTLDVIAQHDVSPTQTWDDNDYMWQLSPYQNKFFDYDPLLRKIKDELDRWSIDKAKSAGSLDKLDQVELKKRIT